MEKISPKICNDIEKSRFRSRSQDFCQFLEGFGIGFGEFGLGKKVLVSVSENLVSKKVSVSENLVSEKTSHFQIIWSRQKALVSENLVLKKSQFWFWETWSRKRKNQNNEKETRPFKQCKALI